MARFHRQDSRRRRNWLAFSLCVLVLFLHCFPIALAHGGDSDDDDDDEPPPNLRRKSLILVKIYCLIIVFFATFIAGVSPYFYRWNQAFLVLGTQFAGGVFLGTAMMHFLSDSTSTFSDLTPKEYPFSYMLACSGYLLTMLADVFIRYMLVRRPNNRKSDIEMPTTKGAVRPVPQNSDNFTGQQSQNKSILCEEEDAIGSHHAGNDVAKALATTTSLSDTLLLIFALCFHSVFEGIAIGVAENAGDAWKALWTISLHKVFAAVAMGIALLRMIPNRPLLQTILYSFAFGISSPIGVAIGIIIDATTEGAVADWMYAISMGLACGVFMYVAINHLFAKGYVPPNKIRVDTPFYKFLAITAGIGIIAVVMIWDT